MFKTFFPLFPNDGIKISLCFVFRASLSGYLIIYQSLSSVSFDGYSEIFHKVQDKETTVSITGINYFRRIESSHDLESGCSI